MRYSVRKRSASQFSTTARVMPMISENSTVSRANSMVQPKIVMSRVPEASVYQVQAEEWSVEDKLSLIATAVAERGSVSFTDLLMRCRARAEMVVTFVALLELVKLGHVGVVQGEAFGDILLVARTPERSEAHATA